MEVVGRGEGLGRPLLYGVSRKFVEHFGLKDLSDLPAPDELPVVLGELQEAMQAEGGHELAHQGDDQEGEEEVDSELLVEAPGSLEILDCEADREGPGRRSAGG